MILHMNLPQNGYDIILERGSLKRAGELLNLNRRVLIVTDTGVPALYAQTLAAQCANPVIETVPTGEGSKSFAVLEQLCRVMMEHHFTRSDCVVAVGGGVVGDLAGFTAASYMRGVDFYNCPTTVLSQVDSSIGGKVAINLDHVKNIVGAFYQPKRVLIDPDVLSTLPARQISNGLAEAVKMSLTSDAELFAIFEDRNAIERIDTVIERALRIKKAVVEEDEKEAGLRRILNFGHTLGHGVEAQNDRNHLYHGECVALGMLPMCAEEVRARLLPVLESLALPTRIEDEMELVLDAASHDKKCKGQSISVVYVPRVGEFEIRTLPIEAWKHEIRNTVIDSGKEST
ncbi:MAG: 3-dehydroquinate synthase [Ruminococcaceae bacterium]|nr:3-dehydroquinate synthase [Oscillospiraceae bacterium]